MTTPPVPDIAEEVDALVRAQPGVTEIYRTSGRAGAAFGAVRDALRADAPAGPLSVVAIDDDGASVAVTIGVASESATRTCRAVHDEIASWLHGRGQDRHTIDVTVARLVSPSEGRG